MIKLKITVFLFFLVFLTSCSDLPTVASSKKTNNKTTKNMKLNKLTDEEKDVIINKGTEIPHTGIYNKHWKTGTYNCKQCDAKLYNSSSKFDGHCGWPSFDDEIKGAVKHVTDSDGRRTEILCANCGGHLGHVFKGEGFTDKNTRHCVNSISLNFKSLELNNQEARIAHFAGGCFWGMEYYFAKQEGVISSEVGYMGGESENPTYKEICTGNSGHYEIIEVVYDSTKVNYETLARLFFEIHDPTQTNGQGPDLGEQYKSVAFYSSEKEKEIIGKLIEELEVKGFKVATKLLKTSKFWKAENYHQEYYENKGTKPYCHGYIKRF